MRAYQDGAHSAEENGAGDCRDIRLLHAIAQGNEGVAAHLIRREVVGLVEVDVVDIGAGDEGLDLQGLGALRDRRGDFFRINYDVLAVVDLEALGLLLLRHRILGLAVKTRLTRLPVALLMVLKVMRSEVDAAVYSATPQETSPNLTKLLPLGTLSRRHDKYSESLIRDSKTCEGDSFRLETNQSLTESSSDVDSGENRLSDWLTRGHFLKALVEKAHLIRQP